MMHKHRPITLERCEKFISKEYFADVNLNSVLYTCKSTDGIILTAFPVPDLARIPFAEAVDNTFTPCAIGDEFGPSWATIWFHVIVDLPRKFSGLPVELHFDNSAEALVYSVQGKCLIGLTGGTGNDRHFDYFLTKSGVPGERFEFYIEAACNGMFGCGEGINPPPPDRKYKLATCELASPNTLAFSLFYDYQVLVSLAKELPTDSQHAANALFAANKICNTFQRDDPKTWQACRDIAKEYSSAQSDKIHHVTAIGHCHIDTAWLWPYDETKRKCARSWAFQISLMEKYPEYKFCCSQAQQFVWLKSNYPELYSRVQEFAAKGQFIPIGGTWVEMDCNIPSGESFVRQFLYGQRFFEQEFGKRHEVFWLPDTFGYASQLPQIMADAGLKYFFTQKLSWNNLNKFPHTTFYWSGLDGTKVLTHFSPADTYCAQATPKELLFAVTNNKDKSYSDESLLVYGNGDGGGGPLPAMIERINRMKDLAGLPTLDYGDPTEFYHRLETKAKDLMTWHGELYFELHRGTYTSQAFTKKMNRACEGLFREVEFLSVLSKSDRNVLDKIELLWKDVLLNQFHDVLPGSSIELAYVDALKIYQKVLKELEELRDEMLKRVAENAGVSRDGEKNSVKLVLMNATSVERGPQVLEIDGGSSSGQKTFDGKNLIVSSGVPAFGITTLDLEQELGTFPSVSVMKSSDGSCIIENQFLTVKFDTHMRMVSLFDKQNNRESIPEGALSKFKFYEDQPLFWDAWDIEVYHLEKSWDAMLGSMVVKESGPLRVVLEAVHPISKTSTLTQRVFFDVMSRVVEFDCHVDWNENRKCLKFEIPCNISCDFATYETQFGTICRPTHFNTSWDLAKFEVCGHRFVDFSEFGYGISVLNDCKYGMAVHGNVVRVTLLRSPKAPDATCDIGEHRFRFGVYPHKGAFDQSGTVQQGILFNSAVVSRLLPVSQISRSYFSSSEANIIIDTIKIPELPLSTCTTTTTTATPVPEQTVILRLYESHGGRGKAIISSGLGKVKAVKLVSVLEEELIDGRAAGCGLTKYGTVWVDFTPFKILTLKLWI